ncbi:MAG: phosphatidate cytidylyltransferase [Clostridia bacterium]|nr:phosphatidate cytidylyltransferase [Clostridia bacterium]
MLKRIGTAVLLLAVILSCVFWLRMYSLIITDIIIMAFAVVGGYEMFKSLKKKTINKAVIDVKDGGAKICEFKLKPMAIPVIACMVIVYPLVYFFSSIGLIITLAVGTISSLITLVVKHEKYSISDVCATIFNIVYPIIIMSILVIMNHSYMGLFSIFSTFAVVVMTDTMAYFVGVTCKGPKLCPNISPKKTISGAVGGVIGGVLGMVIAYLLFCQFNVFAYMNEAGFIPKEAFTIFAQNTPLNLAVLLPLGAITSVIAEFGDLAASMIKRKIGIKDYGNLFPGHGGVTDRIDSFLAVIPVMYFAFELIYKLI